MATYAKREPLRRDDDEPLALAVVMVRPGPAQLDDRVPKRVSRSAPNFEVREVSGGDAPDHRAGRVSATSGRIR
jgi:hypothetical protein